jgi:hypothetical protein
MFSQERKNQKVSGQASVEYLLTLSVVLVGMLGIGALFSDQVNRYLSMLFNLVLKPF